MNLRVAIALRKHWKEQRCTRHARSNEEITLSDHVFYFSFIVGWLQAENSARIYVLQFTKYLVACRHVSFSLIHMSGNQ